MKAPRLNTLSIESNNEPGLALLAQIHRAAFALQDEHAWTESSFRQLLVSPGFEAKIYELDGDPIGFSLVRRVLDEAELISLAVLPALQGKGLAKKIMNLVIEQLKARACRGFFLEVREDNMKAIQLYYKIGFKKVGKRKGYYKTKSGKKVDAFVFSLNFN